MGWGPLQDTVVAGCLINAKVSMDPTVDCRVHPKPGQPDINASNNSSSSEPGGWAHGSRAEAPAGRHGELAQVQTELMAVAEATGLPPSSMGLRPVRQTRGVSGKQ